MCGKGEERGKITDVKSRLAFTRPRCLAADLEFASVDFATVEVEFELNRSEMGRKQKRKLSTLFGSSAVVSCHLFHPLLPSPTGFVV